MYSHHGVNMPKPSTTQYYFEEVRHRLRFQLDVRECLRVDQNPVAKFGVCDCLVLRCSAMVDGRLNVNVAVDRPSYQVSDFTSYLPARLANDGNKNSHFLNCAHTNYTVNPWWTVDLGVKLFVAGVKFTNRGDECGAYLQTIIMHTPPT